MEPSKCYIFLQRTTYIEIVKPYDQFHMVILDLLIIKPRVNIYLSWTVYKVILGETPPQLTFKKCSTLDHNYRWMLEQNMHVSICVCKVCLCVLQDDQEADIT